LVPSWRSTFLIGKARFRTGKAGSVLAKHVSHWQNLVSHWQSWFCLGEARFALAKLGLQMQKIRFYIYE
jgi:hypothetical protein